MKLTKNTLILLTLITFLIAFLMGLEEFFEGELSGEGVVEEVIVYLLILSVLVFTVVAPMFRLVKKFNQTLPWEQFFFKRLCYELGIVLLLCGVLGFIFGNFIHHFIEHELSTLSVLTRTFLFLFIITSLILGIIEVLQISEDRDRLKLLSEKLEKEQIITFYNALKNQVNPHFLYNNLSVLSALIYYDTAKAESFIQAFSDSYRYVLELNQEAVVPIQKELDFLHSWLYLQQIRFSENLTIDLKVPPDILEKTIPPLALQLIFENAIKHNIISTKQPLHIELKTVGDYLEVTNTYQPRKEKAPSTGIGLKNLQDRYQLLSDLMPSFGVKGDLYLAKIPVI